MAASNPTPPFNKDDANRFKNKDAIDTIIPQLFRIVLRWGCKLQGNESFWELLQRKYLGNQDTLDEMWKDRDRECLQANDIGAFDVPLLNNLIPDVCEDFELAGKKKLAQRVTTFMNKLAVVRNENAHNPSTDAISPTILQDIEEIVPKLLNASAELFTIDSQTKNDCIKQVKTMLKELEEKTLNEKDKVLRQIRKSFCSEAKKEIESVVNAESKEFLPASKLPPVRSDVFHECNVTVVTEVQASLPTQENEKTIKCGKLLVQSEDSNIIIFGEPGAGKSTLVRRLREDFVTNQRVIFRGVKNYELMIFMEGRKNGITTIPELIRWNFPDLYCTIKAGYIVEALLMMKVLFVIDGIDEISDTSQQLLQSLIDTFRHRKGTRFIFASRPGATQYLEKEFGRTGCSTTIAKLQPLTNELERIQFLERYQKTIPDIDAPELINAFKGLGINCKKLLNFPVHLALFCFLYQSFPDEVSKWQNELSIMRQILKYSKNLIHERLAQKCLTESGSLASKIVQQACNMAVRQIAQNKMTIQLETYEKLAEDWLDQTGVSNEAIMSCIYVSQGDSETYEYLHLALAEFMAAMALCDELMHNKTHSIGATILIYAGSQRARLSTEEALRYGNTFKFVVMLMFEEGGEMQELAIRTLEDICRYLTEGRMPFSYWAELCLACPSPAVVEAAARAAKTVAKEGTEPSWDVDNPRYMRAATDMLLHHRPSAMRVFTPSSEAAPSSLKPLMKTVGDHFTGALDLSFMHSFRSFTPVDKLITHLLKYRCKLVKFCGCLEGGSDAWEVLSSVMQRALQANLELTVRISLLDPRQHDLSCIHKTSHILEVRAKTSAPVCDQHRRPLPMSETRPPTITVHCTEAGEDEVSKAAALFEDLAPEDKQYQSIWVQHWKGTDDQLNLLTDTLAKAGLSTKSTFKRRWLLAASNRDGSCVVCLESSHWPENEKRCVQILLPQVDPRDKKYLVKVTTDEEMTAVTGQLPDRHFPWLDVLTRKKRDAPLALEPLMKAIGAWHKGTLDLNLRHSYRNFVPVDHLLTHLQSAQCPLVIFRGCLRGDSEQAWRALTAALLRAEREGMKQSLFLSLLEPRKHLLEQLEGTQHKLKIIIRLPLNPVDRCRRPLPASAVEAPVLVVDCSPSVRPGLPVDEKAAAEQAAALIEDLAPTDTRFFMLHLLKWPGTDDVLDELVKNLSAAGVKTEDTGSPPWAPAGISEDEECETCNESGCMHMGRCVQLFLP